MNLLVSKRPVEVEYEDEKDEIDRYFKAMTNKRIIKEIYHYVRGFVYHRHMDKIFRLELPAKRRVEYRYDLTPLPGHTPPTKNSRFSNEDCLDELMTP